ncbi:hypothetical protein AB2B38_012320 [Balneola sp. MJW-20]|uniref:hypothetical protein n=1 Tax=Gracilimonas aurantiaca TaxID=3234185 RepID=UPI0034677856
MKTSHSDIDAEAASSKVRTDWSRRARWFGAEFLVVLTGILVALALNSWWETRQADARERIYLNQLEADLIETERIMADRDRGMAWYTHRPLTELIVSFGKTPRPPRDSVEQWLTIMDYTATPRPVLGTAESLVASGDFGAIRNHSLRAAILRYLDVARERMADQSFMVGLARSNLTELRHLGLSKMAVFDSQLDLREQNVRNFLTQSAADTSGVASSPDWRYPFTYDVMEIYNSQEFFDILIEYRNYIRELQRSRRAIAEGSAELREQIKLHTGE